jgi:hypothetical protein
MRGLASFGGDMTREEFVERMFHEAVVSGVNSCIDLLQRPPGRKPHPSDSKDSSWFNDLNSTDKEFVQRCMARSAEMALFSVFTVLDGVSVIEDRGPKGEFKLFYEKGGQRILLNAPDDEMLHDLMPRSVA